jgi:hypothetical protein
MSTSVCTKMINCISVKKTLQSQAMPSLKQLLCVGFVLCVHSAFAVEVFKINRCSTPPQPESSWSGTLEYKHMNIYSLI